MTDKRDEGLCGDFLKWCADKDILCPSIEMQYSYLAGAKAQRDKAAGLVEVIKSLLPEIYCLYQQAGHGRLDKCKHDDGCIVKEKYERARQALKEYEGE